MEYKKLPLFTKRIDPESREVTGVFAVHGNIDEGNDVSVPGSFGKRLKNGGRDRVRFLWNHDGFSPPIASIKDVREVGRDELPEKVLQWAPEASGGVLVTRKYYEGVPLSEWVFKGIQEGDINEMSYAYELHDYRIEELEEEGKRVRYMLDVELFDISDVNWGMNPATAGVKGLPVAGMTFTQHSEWVATAVADYVKRVQDRQEFRAHEGRTISGSVQETLAKMAVEIQAILKACEPKASEEEVQKALTNYLNLEAQLAGIE
jgi:HK97 family phage prohead protease